jgi:hypothetical protein
MTSIEKVQASVAKLHGGEREQRSRYDSFIAWQIKQRLAASGRESSILKVNEDDPHDAIAYEATFGIPL